MRKFLCFMLALWLTLSLCACSPALIPSSSPAENSPAVVTFADPVLEAMVRASMGKPEGDITAAEAEAVKRLNLSIEWQRYISEEMPIRDISGLECFKNLESLDLSFHAITDIAPVSALKKLVSLSLGGNPIADITPLTELTNLKVLMLSGCTAQDYSPLAKLVNLNFLMLDNTTMTDASSLASLLNLKHLYLEGSMVDYSPLLEIYPNLESKDFFIASTLAELGFIMDDGSKQAFCDKESVSVRINHIEWGEPPESGLTNCIRTVFTQKDYKIDIGYYPHIDAYVMMAGKDGNLVMNYIYDCAKDSFSFGVGDRESSEQVVRAAFNDEGIQDVLLAPIRVFNDTVKSTLGLSANALFALPFEPLTLSSLGFAPDETNAFRVYWEHEPHDIHISILRPEEGTRPDSSQADIADIEFYDHDVGGYSLLILYFADTDKYHIALFKDGVDCAYDYLPATKEYGWEYPDKNTVIQMFNNAFGTTGGDFYQKSLAHFEQFVQERLGMSIGELYALPTGP